MTFLTQGLHSPIHLRFGRCLRSVTGQNDKWKIRFPAILSSLLRDRCHVKVLANDQTLLFGCWLAPIYLAKDLPEAWTFVFTSGVDKDHADYLTGILNGIATAIHTTKGVSNKNKGWLNVSRSQK